MGVTLNGNAIKSASSGCDGIVGREHNANETEFFPHFLAVLFANDLPNIKPLDDAVSNRLDFVSYNKPYVDEPTCDLELKSDPALKDEMETMAFKQSFLRILIEQYWKGKSTKCFDTTPEEVKMARNEWVGEDEVGVIAPFLEEFELTNVQADYVTSQDIDSWLRHQGLNISMKKFARDLKRHCSKERFTGITNGAKKLSGKSKKVWYGIKRRVEGEEEGEEGEEESKDNMT